LRFDFARFDLGNPGIQPFKADEDAPADTQDGQGRQAMDFAVDDVMQMSFRATQLARRFSHRQYVRITICLHIIYLARFSRSVHRITSGQELSMLNVAAASCGQST
jgi:hypothetical protein